MHALGKGSHLWKSFRMVYIMDYYYIKIICPYILFLYNNNPILYNISRFKGLLSRPCEDLNETIPKYGL